MNQEPVKKSSNCTTGCIIFVIIFAFFMIKSMMTPRPEIGIEPREESIDADSFKSQFFWDGSHYKTIRFTKTLMLDPSSFQHVSTTYTDVVVEGHRTISMIYRGTNASGVLVTKYISVKVNLQGDVVSILSKT